MPAPLDIRDLIIYHVSVMHSIRAKIWVVVMALAFLQAVPLACFALDCPTKVVSQSHSCCGSAVDSADSIGSSSASCCRLDFDKPNATIQASSEVSPLVIPALVAFLDGSIHVPVMSDHTEVSVFIPPRADPNFVSPLRI